MPIPVVYRNYAHIARGNPAISGVNAVAIGLARVYNHAETNVLVRSKAEYVDMRKIEYYT
ncbi:hypothetical protein J6590_024582 [Homalodisca vitripennis]|nr:hypothetical protein J6590_024582 [Homalodisca vitripennis]